MKKDEETRKRHSIGMNITDAEMRAMQTQLKMLRKRYKYTRNDVLKVVCMRLLSDEEFIEFCEKKGGLSLEKL
ncbi:MAG: hypothetical protein AB7U24_02865 [Sulfurimonadaceae bacterium]